MRIGVNVGPGHVTGILQAENRQKVDDFEPRCLVNYRH